MPWFSLDADTVGKSPASPVLLRDACEADFDAILSLNLQFEHFLSPLSRARLVHLHRQAAYHRVLHQGGGVAAFLLAFREGAEYDSENYRWFGSRFAAFVYIDRVVVAADRQGRQLGAMLYDDLFRFARDSAVPRVACEFDLDPPNAASSRFHARFGFQQVGTQAVAGGRKRVSLQLADCARRPDA